MKRRGRRGFAVALGVTAVGCVAVARLDVGATTVQGAYAFGNNQTGELADGTTVNRATPVASKDLSGIVTMSAGSVHCLALLPAGTVVAWGHNKSGQLGDGSNTDRPLPTHVVGLTSVRAVSAGTSFSLAVRTDGSVWAWGNNASGELGDGSAPTDHSSPVVVHGLGAGSGVVAVSAGGSHSLALKSDGSVLAWGNNASGQLGDGTAPTDHTTPVAVHGLGGGSGVVAIAAGDGFSVALRGDGSVLAWGNNASGQLGDGSAPTDRSTPVAVHGLGAGSGVRAIVAGGSFAMALRTNGSVVAWGNNQSGELGDGTAPVDQPTPVAVSGLSGVVGIAAGRAQALAVTTSHQVYAWGDNVLGQLGDGSGTAQHTPVLLSSLGSIPAIAVFAGGDHSHVLYGSSGAGPGPRRVHGSGGPPTSGGAPRSPRARPLGARPSLTG